MEEGRQAAQQPMAAGKLQVEGWEVRRAGRMQQKEEQPRMAGSAVNNGQRPDILSKRMQPCFSASAASRGQTRVLQVGCKLVTC